jgi:hypothetical protein
MKMRRFFALAPGIVHRLFAKDDRLWRLFCTALHGDLDFAGLRRLAPFSPLWPLIDMIAWLAPGGGSAVASQQLDRMIVEAVGPHPALSGAGPVWRKGPPRQGATA